LALAATLEVLAAGLALADAAEAGFAEAAALAAAGDAATEVVPA
jgi:hypothetical protein